MKYLGKLITFKGRDCHGLSPSKPVVFQQGALAMTWGEVFRI
jgi:hypothetical protein